MLLPFCPYFPFMLRKVISDWVLEMFFHHSCRDFIDLRIRWFEVFLQEISDVFVRNRTICGIPLMNKSLYFHWLLLHIVKKRWRLQDCQWDVVPREVFSVSIWISEDAVRSIPYGVRVLEMPAT